MELLWKTGYQYSVFHGKKQLFRAGTLETRDAIVCSLYLRYPNCPGVEVTAVALLGGGGCLGGGLSGRPLGLWGHTLEWECRDQSLLLLLFSCYVMCHFLPCATPAIPPRLHRRPKCNGSDGQRLNPQQLWPRKPLFLRRCFSWGLIPVVES